jgi:hypothetical protein
MTIMKKGVERGKKKLTHIDLALRENGGWNIRVKGLR